MASKLLENLDFYDLFIFSKLSDGHTEDFDHPARDDIIRLNYVIEFLKEEQPKKVKKLLDNYPDWKSSIDYEFLEEFDQMFGDNLFDLFNDYYELIEEREISVSDKSDALMHTLIYKNKFSDEYHRVNYALNSMGEIDWNDVSHKIVVPKKVEYIDYT